jgi:4-hydroxybenzoate polyprenyltransferase
VPEFLIRCFGNRSLLKDWLSKQINIPVEYLPWSEDVISIIKNYKLTQGPVFLATATHKRVADEIAEYLGLFDGVLATSGEHNLKGEQKLAEIHRHCQKLGSKEFSYIGDSWSDLPIWKKANDSYIVTRRISNRVSNILEIIPSIIVIEIKNPSIISSWIRLLRPHQWAKNLLIFLPLIMSHQVQNYFLLINAVFAFILFSMTASAVYILNDFADVFSDRAHGQKKKRPIAAGEIPIWQAPIAVAALVSIPLMIGYLSISPSFAGILSLYISANILYSLSLKHKPIIDVIGLALMYTLRIYVGGFGTGIIVSKWLLIFSMFFFLSLAYGKRYQELAIEKLKLQPRRIVRGYQIQDISFIEINGISSSYISIMVLALYIFSPEVTKVYTNTGILFLICPLMTYWITRFWLLTKRGVLQDDPVHFALKDTLSWIIGTGILILLYFAQIIK